MMSNHSECPPPPPPTAAASNYSNNPYVHYSSSSTAGRCGPVDTMMEALGRCGKRLEDAADNFWHHLKVSPSITDAAMARLAQGTKVLTEGGHDKLFHQSFGMIPGEKLLKSYACYLSSSTGPIIGTLYISTKRIGFCSDNPLSSYPTSGRPEFIYFKVVVQVDELGSVNPSSNRLNPSEKYIQIVTKDGHEFWFMGFISYHKALNNLTQALQRPTS